MEWTTMVAIALEHLHPLSNAWTVMEGSRTVRSSYTVNIDSSYRHKTVTEEQPSAQKQPNDVHATDFTTFSHL